MRIRSIRINEWRHFSNIELSLEPETNLVCIVGANGTGKSHLLELISACAHRLGLSQGVEVPRGDPFSDRHDFSLQFFLAPGVSDAIDTGLVGQPGFTEWDRTLAITSRNVPGQTIARIEAGGIVDTQQSTNLASQIVTHLQRSRSVHFLSLDADRAYPKKNININEVAQAYDVDWEGPEYTRGRSFKSTTTLYDEWLKYFLARENQSGTRLMQQMRRAKKGGVEPPEFQDHFEGYASSLQKVLPHLQFTGVDPKKRTLLFDTTGLELNFNQLSGGEREIAFLVGQIDRFALRRGLFLLDEPELHLNADLIRTWVAYLTGTVEIGQVWLATHSLEAVEAAGQHATFVLERDDATRKVNTLARLDDRPVLSALSRAVGTPAFSITKLLFVFVEGEEGVGERERFRRLADLAPDVRFMECGSCHEVLRRVDSTRALAQEAAVGIRLGGIVDRDFQASATVTALEREHGVFVLPVHEVENFFLHPATLEVLFTQNGLDPARVLETIQQAADLRAGSWIFQYGMATASGESLPDMPALAKDRAKGMAWSAFSADRDSAIGSILALTGFCVDDQAKLRRILEVSIDVYRRKRAEQDLWKHCEGKQVLSDVSRVVGYNSPQTLMQAAFAAWKRSEAPISDEVASLRDYLARL